MENPSCYLLVIDAIDVLVYIQLVKKKTHKKAYTLTSHFSPSSCSREELFSAQSVRVHSIKQIFEHYQSFCIHQATCNCCHILALKTLKLKMDEKDYHPETFIQQKPSFSEKSSYFHVQKSNKLLTKKFYLYQLLINL